MSDEPFIAAIVAAPDDDAPRLVYADWLQDRKDPRGELISLQCLLATKPNDKKLKAREKTLLDSHAKTWLEPLARLDVVSCEWSRGFIEKAHVPGTTLAAKASAIFAAVPLLRKLETSLFSASNAKKVAGLRQLGRVESLRYVANGDQIRRNAEIHATFLRSPHLSKLTHLAALDDLGNEAVQVLVANPALAQLRSLQLDGKLGVTAVRALADWAGRGNLRSLSLRNCDLDSKALAALKASPQLGRLQELVL
jgi:uncharacterized protein (TIGR02996 family)